MLMTLAACNGIAGGDKTSEYQERATQFTQDRKDANVVATVIDDANHTVFYVVRDDNQSQAGNDKYSPKVYCHDLESNTDIALDVPHSIDGTQVQPACISSYKYNSDGSITLVCANDNGGEFSLLFTFNDFKFHLQDNNGEIPNIERGDSKHDSRPDGANYIVTDPGRTNVRAGASTDYSVVGQVLKGDYFEGEPASEDHSWIHIKKGRVTGYIHSSKVRSLSGSSHHSSSNSGSVPSISRGHSHHSSGSSYYYDSGSSYDVPSISKH